MIFRTVLDLRDFAERCIAQGLSHAQPMLDRRGCDCDAGPAPLGDPGDGERVSADGKRVYLSCRRLPD